jgi:hypothetical protein
MKTFVILTLVFSSAMLMAQELPPFRGPAAERVEQYKKMRMMEVLKLDEETSLRFFARYNRHQEELKGLGGKRDSLLQVLESYVNRNTSDAEYDRVFKSMAALGNELGRSREKFLQELKEIFTNKQIAEYLVFERRFYESLREIMRDMQRERPGRMRR